MKIRISHIIPRQKRKRLQREKRSWSRRRVRCRRGIVINGGWPPKSAKTIFSTWPAAQTSQGASSTRHQEVRGVRLHARARASSLRRRLGGGRTFTGRCSPRRPLLRRHHRRPGSSARRVRHCRWCQQGSRATPLAIHATACRVTPGARAATLQRRTLCARTAVELHSAARRILRRLLVRLCVQRVAHRALLLLPHSYSRRRKGARPIIPSASAVPLLPASSRASALSTHGRG